MSVPNEGFRLLSKIAPLWKGKYDSKAFYTFMDIVHYNGSSYMAKRDYPEVKPCDDGVNWILIAQKGDKGDGGVTRIKGIAERDFRDGDVVLSPEDIGLGNVQDLDVDGILAHITLELLESVLGVKDLKHKLKHKVNDYDPIVTGVKGPEDDEFRRGDVAIDKNFIGLGKVDNLSLDEHLDEVRLQVKASELEGITKVDDLGFTGIYASDGKETVNLELLEDTKLLLDYLKGKAELPKDSLFSSEAVANLLRDYYRHWIERKFLEDYHPLLKIRGEAEKDGIWHSDEWTVTRKSIGLDKIPNQHPDTYGAGYQFTGFTATDGNNPIKFCMVQGQFSLQPGRTISITFNHTNTSAPIFLDINRSGKREVRINGEKINRHNKTSFKKDGTYVFQYEHGYWNYVSGSTKLENIHNIRLLKSKWVKTHDGYTQFVPFSGLYGDEDFFITSENFSEVERENFVLAAIEGREQNNRGILLWAETRPGVDLPVEVKITR